MPCLRGSDSAFFLSEIRRMRELRALQLSELRLLLLWKPFCLSFPICVSISFVVYETHWPPALLRSVQPAPPQKPTLYLEGGEKMLSAMRHLSVNPPLGGAAGGGRPFGSPRGLRAPRPAQCCRPGRGAPALRKPECSLSSPRTPFSARLESYQTSSGGQTARSCFQLLRGGEEREVLEPRAWSKTGREPTPSLFLKGVSESRSGPESQRTGSHLPLKVGFIQSEHLYWAPAVCLAPV